jgi:hypothetical protein
MSAGKVGLERRRWRIIAAAGACALAATLLQAGGVASGAATAPDAAAAGLARPQG